MKYEKTFLLRQKHDWAMITITEKFGLTLMIHSSYGNWAYTWAQPGEDAVKFLRTSNPDYMFTKFSNGLKLAVSGRIQKREYVSFIDFYSKFWSLLVDNLVRLG